MTRRPDDKTPEPSGGRAAERLREFIAERFPEKTLDQASLPAGLPEEPAQIGPGGEQQKRPSATPPKGKRTRKTKKTSG